MMRETPARGLTALFEGQRTAFAGDPFPTLAQRLDRLARLQQLLERHEQGFSDAICADFGHRSAYETEISETFIVRSAIGHSRRHLKRWMEPQRVPTSLHSLPGRSFITPQPLGVVGIVSPWNYPLQLALAPAVAALSAGNRVMIKPSELTPRFSQLLAQAVGEGFAPEECAVLTGGPELAQAFVALPFDHLFFTGSTAVGRRVALAAAANLTPVTLELGGKSPAIVDASSDIADAARKIAAGKLFNAGQTCIAPDYVMVPADRVEEFARAYQQAALRLYPTLQANPDYTSIVNDRHHARLAGLVADAQAQGARVLSVHAAAPAAAEGSRKMGPCLLLDVSERMAVMQEEIFGPLLPVLPYTSLDAAIAYVNARPRPLALYWFGKDAGAKARVLRETVSGGVTVNDALLHVAQENLPFGGVGASGSGAYHGPWGFRLFSHQKAVFEQSSLAGTALVRPPYGRFTAAVLRVLRRLA